MNSTRRTVRRHCSSWLFVVILLAHADAFAEDPTVPPASRNSATAAFTFEELVQLSATAHPTGGLGQKLDTVLTQPMVSNAASGNGGVARRPVVEGLGPVLRVAFWNIERGAKFDLIAAALGHESTLDRLVEARPGMSGDIGDLRADAAFLADADVVVLNEVDFGMPRSGYRHVAAELATLLEMNYAFGVEFVELGEVTVDTPSASEPRPGAQGAQRPIDPQRYVGLHGTAVLSRYPIVRADVHRLDAGYDWYGAEQQRLGPVERFRRWSAHRVFAERIVSEVRHGSRVALVVTLGVPDVPAGEVTVVATHLENKCNPACRRRQMQEVLTHIGDVRTPVILAGDLNTTGRDASSTSAWRNIRPRLMPPQFSFGWLHAWLSPTALPRLLLLPANHTRAYLDPTRRHVPVFSANPERGLFGELEGFRFADGGAFEFREPGGCGSKSGKTLGNSNARGRKGFQATYTLRRHYPGLAGLYKTDWLIIKPTTGTDEARLTPHAPRTFSDLDKRFGEHLSDHHLISVDLPLSQATVACPGRRQP